MYSQISLEAQLKRWNEAIASRPEDPRAYIQRGMVNFKLARIDPSIQDFDRAEELDASITPYLWQRGLSYYYAERYPEGAQQFEVDLKVNSQDVEETVWRYLCIARSRGVTAAQNSLLVVRDDPRLVMRRVYDLYAGNCTINDVLAAGESSGKTGNFYSHLYLGLYWEAAGDEERSGHYILKAVTEYAIDDYMWHLAKVHQTLRGWT